HDGILRGRSFVASLGEGLPNDLILRPHHWHGASFDKGNSQQEVPGSLMGSIALLRQVFLDVDWYTDAHAAYSLNPNQIKPEFNAALEALAAVKDRTLIFETNDELSLVRADRVAREFGLPIVHVGSGREYIALKQIKQTGASLILPLNFPKQPKVRTIEDELDLSLAELRHWETAPSNAAMVNDAQITFALSTHRLKKTSEFLTNVRKAIDRGLPKEKALAALTTVPAELCGIGEMAGSLEPGKLANFLICDGDVFDKDATIHSVWIEGKEHELKPIPAADMRGEYALRLDTMSIRLKFTGTESKLKGEYGRGDESFKLEHVSSEDNKLNFSIRLDTLGSGGLLRFTGRFEDGTLVGWMNSEDGTRQKWTANRTNEYVAERDTSKSVDPEQLLSKLTFPNKAYAPVEAPEQQDVLVKNATVWTAESDGVLEGTDLLVRGGTIAEIGVDLKAADDVPVIDATGMHVTPGIIDAHSHIAISGDVNEGTEAITSEVRIADVVNPYDIAIYQQLAGGVTASHLLHGSANPIGGQLQLIKLRWGGTDEELKYRNVPSHIKFALGENVKQSNWGERYRTRYPQTRMGAEAIIRDAFQAAREYEASLSEYDALGKKDRSRTVPPRRDLELEALVEVLNSRMPVACHAYVQSEMLMLIRLAAEYGFQVRSFEHGLEAYKIASELAEAGVGVCTFSDWWAYKFEVYEAIPYGAALLHEGGALTVIKSDSREMARRLNQEAGKTIRYGDIDPVEALKMVTINAARVLGVDDRIGSIKAGKDADFVIWNGPPLSMYSKPHQTWIDGKKYFDIEVDRLLRARIREEKNGLIQKITKLSDRESKYSPESKGDDHPEGAYSLESEVN
ncbi:MAG: amidohydrolase family protein, partial [candidate division Zixibacteria bacterium]|nr:amidohydrolase family protein [candidate division Zixibacteria bacterium]